ncbi:MAG: hypothetical protein H8K04_06605 [Nitrospira sp.]
MMRAKSPLVQQTLAGITLILVLGALAMVWPVMITLFLGVLLLIQSCGAEQEIAVLVWTEVGEWSIFIDSFRRPGFSAMV